MCACCAMPRDSCSTCSGHESRPPPASSAARALLTYSVSARPHSRSTASASRARPPSAISSASLIPRLNWPLNRSPLPISAASRLRSATRSRVSVTPSRLVNPTTPIRSIAGRPSMNRDAAASAGRPSSRRMCASSTATTTIRPSSAPCVRAEVAAGNAAAARRSTRPGQQTVQKRCAADVRRPRCGSPRRVASGTGRPSPSSTAASTVTRSTPERNVGCCAAPLLVADQNADADEPPHPFA